MNNPTRYWVMIDYEQSVSDHATIEEARAAGQLSADQELLPCSFSIADDDGNTLEGIVRSDGKTLGELMTQFNQTVSGP